MTSSSSVWAISAVSLGLAIQGLPHEYKDFHRSEPSVTPKSGPKNGGAPQVNPRWLTGSLERGVDKSATADIDLNAPAVPTDNVSALFAFLQALRTGRVDWDSDDGVIPTAKTIETAEKVLAMLPPASRDAGMGLGGEGDLYFVWQSESGSAFLTVEQDTLHLLLKPKGAAQAYHDDLRYDQALLSNRVLPALAFFGKKSSADPASGEVYC